MVKKNYLTIFGVLIKRMDLKIQNLANRYVYASILNFFIGLCVAKSGAEKVVDSGLVDVLVDLKITERKPIDTGLSDKSSSDEHVYYYDLWLPFLNLIVQIGSVLGTEHHKCQNLVRKTV
jgi:hypothetical protein